MKVTLKVSDAITIELDTTDQQDTFKQIANLQEVFGIGKCGKCGCTEVKYVLRTNDDDEYFELHCEKCHAKFEFGCHKKGKTLFPKRKDKEGGYRPDNGWMRWDKEAGKLV